MWCRCGGVGHTSGKNRLEGPRVRSYLQCTPTDPYPKVKTLTRRSAKASGRLVGPRCTVTPMRDYRKHLQKRYGVDGEALWDVLDCMIAGRPWVPVLPDGREAPPVVPTTADRVGAVKLALAYLHGSPVNTVEVRGKLEHHHVRAQLEALDTQTLARIASGEVIDVLPEPSVPSLPSGEPQPQPFADWFQAPDDAG